MSHLCPKGSLVETVKEKDPGGPRFTWKTAVETEVAVVQLVSYDEHMFDVYRPCLQMVSQ